MQVVNMFPKIHIQENFGKQVIRPVNCHTTSISQFVDPHLQPHIKDLKSYVKDSTGSIKKINNLGTIHEKNILVTMEVCSLHTNTPHKEA